MAALIILLGLAGTTSPAGAVRHEGSPLLRDVHLIYEVTCRSTSGQGRLSQVEIRTALPSSDERQTVSDLRFDVTPSSFVSDQHGNRFAVWKRPRLLPGELFRVGWRIRMESRAIHHNIGSNAGRPIGEMPNEIGQRYLADGERYVLGDPALRSLAREISTRAKSPFDVAASVNRLLGARLTYVNDGRWEPAPKVLQNGHGSCSEYTFSFISLARLCGLPARWVGAAALRSDAAIYEDTVHHRWAEVWIPGHGWFPVDPSRNDGEDAKTRNRYFGRTSKNLLVLMRSDGGADQPLGWGYVGAARSRRHGDARRETSKRFVWTRSDSGN